MTWPAIEDLTPDRIPAAIAFLAAKLAEAQQHQRPAPNGPERVYTIPEVADLLQISEYRAYELARQGKLPHSKIGKSVRVTAAQLAVFQHRQERT